MDNHDKRSVARRELSHIARVATGVGAPIECRMTDVSFTGARLLVRDASAVPQHFMIVLNDKLSRWCEVIWRDDKSVGLKFTVPPKTLNRKSPRLASADNAKTMSV